MRISMTIRTLTAHWHTLRRWQKIGVLFLVSLLILLSSLYVWLFWDLPSIDRLQAGLQIPTTRLYDRHGNLLYEVIDPHGGRNVTVALSDIPPALVQATIATEDRNFYQTHGVDPQGILRALWINLSGGEVRAGGSTITQQIARTLLFDPQQRAERTLRRKLREMILAVQLANNYNHEQILALYLNQVYYGNLAYGVSAAAQTYFDKPLANLTVAECAMLAGLAQSPATYDPLTNPQAAKDRQRIVLDLMVQAGYLTSEQADAAFKQPLQYGSGKFTINAPHFVQLVWSQLEQTYGAALYEGGLEVTTTLDLHWQQVAQQAAERHLIALNHPTDGTPPHNVHGAALVAIDPHTGQVLTLLGNVNYFDDADGGAINMAVTPRQPGSTLKPFTYALTFDPFQTQPWTPATMLLDISTPFVTRELQSYTPTNYGLVEHGPVLIREALASSYNIPAAIALNKVGVRSLTNLLHKLGITTLSDPTKLGLSLTLGGGDIKLLELTAAYAAFANEGRPVQPVMLLEVKKRDGTILYQWTPPAVKDRVIDPKVAFLISDILSDNQARLPSFGSHSALSIGRPAAAKTGTTTDFRDNWTMGYTPDLVVGVWAGNPDNSPMVDVSGVTGAGPIWNEFIRTVLNGQPETPFKRPDGLVQAEVCAASGLLPTQYCPKTRLEWFILGTVPTDTDTMFQAFVIDRRTGLQATDATPDAERVQRVYQVLPQEARLWALAYGIEPPPLRTDEIVSHAGRGFRLLTPDPYTIYQLTPLIPFEAQQIRLSVIVEGGTQRVDYYLNDALYASVTADPWDTWWALKPGEYTLIAKATMQDGSLHTSTSITFRVVSYVPPEQMPSSGAVQ